MFMQLMEDNFFYPNGTYIVFIFKPKDRTNEGIAFSSIHETTGFNEKGGLFRFCTKRSSLSVNCTFFQYLLMNLIRAKLEHNRHSCL